METVDLNYLASTGESSHLLDALKGKEDSVLVYHIATVNEVREEMKKKKLTASGDILRKVVSVIDKNGDWRLNYLKEKRTGTWLVATPTFICGTFPFARIERSLWYENSEHTIAL